MTRRALAFARRRPWTAMALAGIGAALVAAIVVSSGVFRITASSGHWAITERLLHYSMRRSVVTQSLLGPSAPADLDSEARVIQGATHYDIGCRPCHGAPGRRMPVVPGAMTPHPPALPPRIGTWDARELFYIVKHGVKFTGMPAWPALQRDDEVWAMVAFLRRLPSLDAGSYDRLAGVTTWPAPALLPTTTDASAPPDVVVEQCARCHGTDGLSRGVSRLPRLAGQRERYLANAMRAYAEGRRFSGTMMAVAAALPPGQRDQAVRYYASLDPSAVGNTATAGDPARGAAIARDGVPARDIPACDTCHQAPDAKDAYPRLAGQPRQYLVTQLQLLQSRGRGGSEYVHLMHEFVDQLTPDDIDDVAAHYAAGGS